MIIQKFSKAPFFATKKYYNGEISIILLIFPLINRTQVHKIYTTTKNDYIVTATTIVNHLRNKNSTFINPTKLIKKKFKFQMFSLHIIKSFISAAYSSPNT